MIKYFVNEEKKTVVAKYATPEFRAKISPLSFCLNGNIERLIDKIEEFLNKLIVFNWKAYEEMDIRHS